jgi:[amino group carrier protein]-L-2-aminoadipate 6-kinase
MILVKAGGGAGLNWPGLAEDLAAFRGVTPVALIHGANAARADLAARLGVPVRTVLSPAGISSVYTDDEAMDIFCMAYPGLANSRIVACLQSHGLNAVGLSGLDGRLWEAKAKKDLLIQEDGKTKLLRNNRTGRVEKVNAGLIRILLDHGYLPVMTGPAISRENEIVNTDNDGAAAAVAAALGVETLVFLLEAPGFLRDAADPQSLVASIPRDEIDRYGAFAQGRMKKKWLGIKQALDAGVREIFLGDGRTAHPLRDALDGRGTVIR